MKVTRFLLVVLLAPVAGASVWSFFEMLVRLGREISETAMPFWAGFAAYFIFQVLFFKPIRTYIFGHELTHAIAGILSGAKLKSFKVSASGGSVVLTKTSIWIALAPYFVPLYPGLVIAAYWIASLFWQVHFFYPYFLFLVGFSLAFHLGLTFYALSQEQSDIRQFGTLLSAEVILIINCLALSLIFRILFPGCFSFRELLAGIFSKTAVIIAFAAGKAKELWDYFPLKK